MLYNAGVLRNRKKRELRAAGIRLPNVYNENPATPSYMCTKSTQTGLNTSKANSDKFTESFLHSTPTSSKLQRRRSLSVGSSPVAISSPAKESTNRNLFTSTLRRNPFSMTPKKKPSQACVRGEKENLAHVDSTKSSETSPTVVKKRRYKKLGKLSGDNAKVKIDASKYSAALIEVCQEFDRQHRDAKALHERNKRERRYHFCPKMNFESSGKSEDDIALTDTSCTSTCVCVNEKSTFDKSYRSTSADDTFGSMNKSSFLLSDENRGDKDQEDDVDVDTSNMNAAPMLADDMNKSTMAAHATAENSSFLHLSLSEDEDEEEPGGMNSTKSNDKINVDKKSSTNAAQPVATKRPSAVETAAVASDSKGSTSTAKKLRQAAIEESTLGKDGKYPDEYQPEYFTQVRARFPDSPKVRLFKHLSDVNTSGAKLDLSLVPEGSPITYSPKSNRISVDIPPYDGDPAETNPIPTQDFYKKASPKK